MNDICSGIAGSISNRMLHLILFPTEECNFRCLYCYESFRNGRMNQKTIEGIKNFLSIRIPELSSLHVSWFGGEPLLALDIIEEISDHIICLIRQHDKCHYYADITTNAYHLTVPVFEKLCRLNVGLYQISFDGQKEQHDKKRVLACGQGTFDHIWSNLMFLKETDKDVSFLIRLHLDKENFPHIYPFVEGYHRTFGHDPRFRLFYRPLSQLGGSRDALLQTFGEEEGKMAVDELIRYSERFQIRNKSFTDFPTICYASKLNSFVIRADGVVGKCTVALDGKYNEVGRIRRNGTLIIDKRKLFRWARGIQSGDKRELFCPMENICCA